MTPYQFVAKWKAASDLSERSACQQHFLDLCELLGEKKPAEVDPSGNWFTFEKGLTTTEGRKGFADVWRRGFFGWEYKGKHKDLKAAYQQLLKYREALLNPPLLVVCDLDRFEVHTNFPNTIKEVYAFDLDGLADPKNIARLRAAFTAPEDLKPGKTQQQVTEEIAGRFSRLARGLQDRGAPAAASGHFLMKLMFCMFAEDMDLLPRDLFTRTVTSARGDPARLSKLLGNLFLSMAKGEPFGADDILRFNGRLFDDAGTIDLTKEEIAELLECAACDWSQVEPSIFGTLFERILDPEKRGQLGAHYTSREDIETLLHPVLRDPLRREWDAVRAKVDALGKNTRTSQGSNPKNLRKKIEATVVAFLDRLAHTTVLDPACGSGNFLYVALHLLLDLEKEVLAYLAAHVQQQRFPNVRPMQLHGLEVNGYARELAQVVIWIGFHQWIKFNGFLNPVDPVLEAMDTVRCQDAILDRSDPANPKEPDWPDAEFIVGNPPFLGDKKLRGGLGDDYVEALHAMYRNRIPGQSDLCCYWFEKARAMIEAGRAKRAGLIATQNIRGGANRRVLDRICNLGRIYFGVSDRDWVLDGAMVHISMVGFDGGADDAPILDGKGVDVIHANLTTATDTTRARILTENRQIGFIGSCKGGPFDMEENEAMTLITHSGNPHGKPNSDVVRPVLNSKEVTGRSERRWIIDFGSLDVESASLYGDPFRLVETRVKPLRDVNRDKWLKENWWRPQRMRPEMRSATSELPRFLVTPTTSKHRVFTWLVHPVLPDHQLVVFARSDDYFFGVLHSRVHEVWARAQGTQLREAESGFRYTPTTCFETFPFPEPSDAQREAVAAAAQQLDTLRSNWLNPPEWTRTEVLEFPGSVDGPWKRYITDADPARGIGTVRYPRTVAKDTGCAAKLKPRTLTNLYNERPAWLAAAHAKLDTAVFAAYGWPADLPDDELLARLLALNLSRSGAAPRG